LKILLATAEAVPYFKTGGLADVARALPDQLAAAGHDVHIMLPLYEPIRQRFEAVPVAQANLPLPGGPTEVLYREHRTSGAPALLVEHPLFDTSEPYEGDPMMLARRFAIFCRAVLERARALQVDVIHLNDWQTGLVPLYSQIDGGGPPTVFAIHNLAYQGNFRPEILPALGIPATFFRMENGIEFYGEASFLKSGLALSDQLVTVSPTHAREIQTPEYGAGMEGVLSFRRRSLHGILNGIDPNTWNPATDTSLPHNYDARTIEGKDACRTALLDELGLEDGGPLFTSVTRLAYQKGIDILLQAAPAILAAGGRLAVLGDGDPGLEYALSRLVVEHPRRVAAFFRFDDGLARRLYAGGDYFVMPSRYEPCGLGQMIAQRYGQPPVVRHTGGLVDTVHDAVTGFVFDSAHPLALSDAARRAIEFWRGPDWDAMRRRCMDLDRSWSRSAALYSQVYRLAVGSITA
jgi:starch synthase